MSRIQEIRDVMNAIHQSFATGQKSAMLMITEVHGSAYRQPGAKMMIAADGTMCGTLSGGCLESDLLGWTEKAIEQNRPLLRHYDLTENDIWSLGIGCRGSLEILITPIEISDQFWLHLQNKIKEDQLVTLVLELPAGARVLIDKESNQWGDTKNIPEEVLLHAISLIHHRTRAEIYQMENRRFVIDTIRPSEKLIIAGAGHDSVPLASMAHQVGFDVTVLDPRSKYNNSQRFPQAKHLVTEPTHAKSSSLQDSWWVIMNHQQQRDEESLALALKSDPKFVGVLGPLSRTEEMLEKIGHTMESGPIYAPVGLDLAAETVEEVAVSIISQLMAKRNGRDASPLHGQAKIHK